MSVTLKYTRYYRHLFLCCSLSDKGLLACVIVFLAIPRVATGWIRTISRSYNAALVLSPFGEDVMIVELAAVSGRRKKSPLGTNEQIERLRFRLEAAFLKSKEDVQHSRKWRRWFMVQNRRHLQDRLWKYQDSSMDTQALCSSSRNSNSKSARELRLRWCTKQTAEHTGEWKHHPGAPWRRSAFFCLLRVCVSTPCTA